MIAVLRNRNYAFFWIGALISNIGDWVLAGALPFYVYTRTGSALATGLIFIASSLPWVALSSIAGVFADRWDRKRTMIVADLSRAVLILLLLLVVYVQTLFWLVYLVGFIEACITQFFNPASSALIPQIVGESRLQDANALSSFSSSTSRLVGPLLGSVLLGILGLSSTVIADSISYVCSAFMIALVLVPSTALKESIEIEKPAAVAKWLSYWNDWLQGLSVVRKERNIASLFVVVGMAALAEGVINAVLVIFPAAVLHLGPAQYGEMLTALGIGAIIGSVLLGFASKLLPPTLVLWLGLLGKGVTYLLAFTVRSFPVILVLLVLSGIPSVSYQVSTQTLLQLSVKDDLRGRVFGAYVATLSLLLLLGTGIGSVLANSLSVVLVLGIGCSLFLLSGVAARLLLGKALYPSRGNPRA